MLLALLCVDPSITKIQLITFAINAQLELLHATILFPTLQLVFQVIHSNKKCANQYACKDNSPTLRTFVKPVILYVKSAQAMHWPVLNAQLVIS